MKNTRKILRSTTSKNYKAFLLFLILTLILWFAIQLTKSYKFQTELTVQLSNIPKHIVLDATEQKLSLNLNSNGFKLWRYNVSSNTISIDFNDFEKDSLELQMSPNELKNRIASTYEFNTEDIIFDQTALVFNYDRKETKLVPINSKIKLNFASGYNTLENLKLSPDSVMISGSLKALENVNFIATREKEIENINDTLRGDIQLIKPASEIDISYEKVKYYLPVEKYSENTLMIGIETINVPDSLELSVFPNQAKVTFLVALKSFEKVSKLDFKVICDYNKRYQKDAIMIPKLTQYPDYILNPKLLIRKVDYLVKQKP